MNVELIKEILIVSIGSSIFSTALIQKIKESKIIKSLLFYISFIISGGVGILFSLSFTDLNIVSCIWVGFVTWVGADAIYKSFEDKIFLSYKALDNTIEISRNIDG